MPPSVDSSTFPSTNSWIATAVPKTAQIENQKDTQFFPRGATPRSCLCFVQLCTARTPAKAPYQGLAERFASSLRRPPPSSKSKEEQSGADGPKADAKMQGACRSCMSTSDSSWHYCRSDCRNTDHEMPHDRVRFVRSSIAGTSSVSTERFRAQL